VELVSLVRLVYMARVMSGVVQGELGVAFALTIATLDGANMTGGITIDGSGPRRLIRTELLSLGSSGSDRRPPRSSKPCV
jgi:hypothetical protein